jgi:hypothetical protein
MSSSYFLCFVFMTFGYFLSLVILSAGYHLSVIFISSGNVLCLMFIFSVTSTLLYLPFTFSLLPLCLPVTSSVFCLHFRLHQLSCVYVFWLLPFLYVLYYIVHLVLKHPKSLSFPFSSLRARNQISHNFAKKKKKPSKIAL